ncbi:acetyltransferase [Dyadobacter sp. CY323]|uniref:acetyltransferase n=1 Tax=Dyadobacter sp. CY323 TaxID=2907302 RepID=UPI001F1AE113|nr:acetyltransferase [Dyadobacter sp. CY323]MCE6988836.1 acetyltransferase [Dyadobacter sp. CY323]
MIIYGAGGHAKVISGILAACGETLLLVFDDDITRNSFSNSVEVVSYIPELFPDENLIIAIGDNLVRRSIASKVSHQFGNAIHPSALIDTEVCKNSGIVIMQNVVIQAGSSIGTHVIVNTSAVVDHDCALGDFVHVGPGATLCGNVVVGENTLVGAGSTVIPNIQIGKNCKIGAGTVVTKDIPDNVTVYGNPGKIIL